jgi:site-specific DNA-cytosine methylase
MAHYDISDNFIQDKSYCLDAHYASGTSVQNFIEKSRRQLILDRKSGCLTAGAHSGGLHSDMELIVSEASKKGFTTVSPGECFDGKFLNSESRRGRKMKEKSHTLISYSQNDLMHFTNDYRIRRLTPVECERLQTVPDNYTSGVSDTQRYKMLGNGWTVDVIAHIFSFMGK